MSRLEELTAQHADPTGLMLSIYDFEELADLQQHEINHLRAIVAKLPETADGVRVTPGAKVWRIESDGTICVRYVQWTPVDGGLYGAYWGIQGPPVAVEKCYSAQAAAQAAEGK